MDFAYHRMILNLKSGKVANPDGVRSKHMKMGAKAISELLAKLFTAMTIQGVPHMMKHDKKLPLPNKLKDQIYMDNHRFIVITSCFTKIYENIKKKMAETHRIHFKLASQGVWPHRLLHWHSLRQCAMQRTPNRTFLQLQWMHLKFSTRCTVLNCFWSCTEKEYHHNSGTSSMICIAAH